MIFCHFRWATMMGQDVLVLGLAKFFEIPLPSTLRGARNMMNSFDIIESCQMKLKRFRTVFGETASGKMFQHSRVLSAARHDDWDDVTGTRDGKMAAGCYASLWM